MFNLNESKNIIVYGAGKKGKRLCKFMESIGVSVIGVIDRNKKMWGKTIIYSEKRCVMIYSLDHEFNIKKKI